MKRGTKPSRSSAFSNRNSSRQGAPRGLYLAQLGEVGLVAHQHHGGVVVAAHAVNELLELAHLVEAAPVRDGVADDEALASPHVLVPHGRELCLGTHSGILAPRM